jgi:hypothetical protein
LESWEPTQLSLLDTGKPRKPFAEVADGRIFRIMTSRQQPGKKSKEELCRMCRLINKVRVIGSRESKVSVALSHMGPNIKPQKTELRKAKEDIIM